MSKAYSWAPFSIDYDMLKEIMAHYNTTPEFLPVVLSFRRQTTRLEEAFADSVWVVESKPLWGKSTMIIRPLFLV
jgi:hypothetical protein